MIQKIALLIFVAASFCLNSYAEEAYDACVKWTAPWPDVEKPDAGLEVLPGVKHYTIFTGSKELGMFNHGPMLIYFNGRLYATWFSHAQYEDAPGTRALFSYTTEKVRLDNSGQPQHQFVEWSAPQVLIDSIGPMTGKGEQGTGFWPVFKEVNGRLFAVATVKRMIDWKKDGNATVPVYRDLPKIAKRVSDEGIPDEDIYWLDDNSPQGYEFIKPYNKASDEMLRNDLTDLKKQIDTEHKNYSFPKTEDDAAFCEPTYFTRPDGKEVGLYRDQKRCMRLYAALRDNPGDKWSQAFKTNIPDSPSKSVAGSLPDGKVYLIGNNLDKLWLRDPLLISTSKDGINFDKAYTLRCGATNCREKNPGDHKGPGFQYPDALVVGDSLWVSYSISKEQIAISRIPLETLK